MAPVSRVTAIDAAIEELESRGVQPVDSNEQDFLREYNSASPEDKEKLRRLAVLYREFNDLVPEVVGPSPPPPNGNDSDDEDEDKFVKKLGVLAGASIGGVGGAVGGAMAGFLILGVPGACVGGVVGGVLGLIVGGVLGYALSSFILRLLKKMKSLTVGVSTKYGDGWAKVSMCGK